MCGIAGYHGAFDPALLERMGGLIAHRGPDGSGTWFDKKAMIGLAHRRLSIIDLRPEASQPMSNEDATVWVSFNGEIYNFQELRMELVTKGHRFKSNSDTEVLVHLYEDEGVGMLRRLNGMFAFALWDGNKRELFLARDGFGVKPLYYAETRQGFIFASEIKALLAHQNLPRDLDLEALHYYLAFLWAPAPHTMLKAVRKFEAGEAMIVREGRVARRWTFFDFDYNGSYRNPPLDTLASGLRDLLTASVRRQRVSDVPIGAFLSGGLDSSSIVAMASRDSGPFPCYSIGFDGDTLDGSPSDLPYAKKVARHLGVDLREIRVAPSIIDHLERIIWHLDEPQADPAPINVMLIAEHARRDGVKVLLSGAGGDELFSGYRRHQALRLEACWSWLPRSVRRALASGSLTIPIGSASGRRLAKMLVNADRSPDGRICGYFQWSSDATRRAIYSPDVAQKLARTATDGPFLRSLERIPSETDRLNRMLYLDARHFLADHNLVYTDKASMAAGVEVRVPFLDPDLVAFATSLPPSLKRRGNEVKTILKHAMEPILPHEIVYRPKTGFGAPLRHWLKHELRDMVRDRLSISAINSRGLFDGHAVQTLIRENEQGHIDAGYLIYSLLSIEIWCDLFLSSQSVIDESLIARAKL